MLYKRSVAVLTEEQGRVAASTHYAVDPGVL